MTYVVRECTEKDYPAICSFFNKNNKYQIGENPLNIDDIILSFKLKEMKHFYGLFNENTLLGTTGLFDFIFEAKHYDNSIFSGFLLIDKNVRDGSAIKKLFMALQNTNNMECKTYLCEINSENKPSLQLAKMNGYVEFNKSWEDYSHHILLRSDLSKIKNINSKHNDIINYKFLESYWENNSYFSNFLFNKNNKILFGIINSNPWFINTDQYTFKYYNGCLHYNIKDNNLTCSVCGKYTKKIILKKNKGSLNIRNNKINLNLYKSQDLFGKYTLENRIFNKECKKSFIKPNINKVINEMKIDKVNGDIIYVANNIKLIKDIFPRINSEIYSKITIEEKNNNHILITSENSNYVIKKDVFILNNSVKNKITFISSNATITKYGLLFLHNNYYVNTSNKKENFSPYEGNKYTKNHSENDDFVKASLFTNNSKKYYFPEFDLKLSVETSESNSNQMTYRPLIIKNLNYKNIQKSFYNLNFQKKYDDKQNVNLSNYNFIKLDIKKIFSRIELSNEPTFISRGVKKLKEINFIKKDDLLIINDNIGHYTGIYFQFKIQGRIFACHDKDKIELHDNGMWLEFPKYVFIINESKKNFTKIISNDSRLFMFKKHNTIYMRIVHDNYKSKKIIIRNER